MVDDNIFFEENFFIGFKSYIFDLILYNYFYECFYLYFEVKMIRFI